MVRGIITRICTILNIFLCFVFLFLLFGDDVDPASIASASPVKSVTASTSGGADSAYDYEDDTTLKFCRVAKVYNFSIAYCFTYDKTQLKDDVTKDKLVPTDTISVLTKAFIQENGEFSKSDKNYVDNLSSYIYKAFKLQNNALKEFYILGIKRLKDGKDVYDGSKGKRFVDIIYDDGKKDS